MNTKLFDAWISSYCSRKQLLPSESYVVSVTNEFNSIRLIWTLYAMQYPDQMNKKAPPLKKKYVEW